MGPGNAKALGIYDAHRSPKVKPKGEKCSRYEHPTPFHKLNLTARFFLAAVLYV
jgi:hypothetical protein